MQGPPTTIGWNWECTGTAPAYTRGMALSCPHTITVRTYTYTTEARWSRHKKRLPTATAHQSPVTKDHGMVSTLLSKPTNA